MGAMGGMAAMQPNAMTAFLQQQVIEAAMAASKTPAQAAQTLLLLQAGGGGQLSQGLQGGCGRGTASPKIAITMESGTVTAEYQQALQILSDCASSGRMVQDEEILWLIGVREKLRYKKEFQAADDLRNALRNSLSLELFEKEKRWSTADGRQGAIPMFSDLK